MKDKLTFKDVEDAVAALLRSKNPNSEPDYYVFLMGVRLILTDQDCSFLFINNEGHRAIELQGTPALDWIAAACREKAAKEKNDGC